MIVGISAGSMNTGGMSLYPMGEEKSASDFIIKVWEDVRRKNVFRLWNPPSLINGLLRDTGLVNTEPLKEYLTTLVDKP